MEEVTTICHAAKTIICIYIYIVYPKVFLDSWQKLFRSLHQQIPHVAIYMIRQVFKDKISFKIPFNLFKQF